MKMESLICLAVGLVGGFFSGYFILHGRMQKSYDAKMNEELQSYISACDEVEKSAEQTEKEVAKELAKKYHKTNKLIKEIADMEHVINKDPSCEVILEDGYINNANFEKEEAYYYPEDDLLTDTSGEPYDDYSSIIGTSFMLYFGKYSDDPDVVYVRNHALRCDFQVTRVDGHHIREENDE